MRSGVPCAGGGADDAAAGAAAGGGCLLWGGGRADRWGVLGSAIVRYCSLLLPLFFDDSATCRLCGRAVSCRPACDCNCLPMRARACFAVAAGELAAGDFAAETGAWRIASGRRIASAPCVKASRWPPTRRSSNSRWVRAAETLCAWRMLLGRGREQHHDAGARAACWCSSLLPSPLSPLPHLSGCLPVCLQSNTAASNLVHMAIMCACGRRARALARQVPTGQPLRRLYRRRLQQVFVSPLPPPPSPYPLPLPPSP